MNRLEAYHRVGLIELLQTSTLPVEFITAPPQRKKSEEYNVIGSSGSVYLTSGPVADASPGTPINESRFSEIQRIVFGDGPFSSDAIRIRAQRDSLHIDQAWQEGADYLVTDDKALLDATSTLTAAGIALCICTAEDCQSTVENFFYARYGTSVLEELAVILDNEDTVLIGSNSTQQIELKDATTGSPLVGIIVDDRTISVRATIRGATGEVLVAIVPGEPFSFTRPGARIAITPGGCSLLLGQTYCKAFTIFDDVQSLLAGRMLRSGRFLLHHALLYDQSGSILVRSQ